MMLLCICDAIIIICMRDLFALFLYSLLPLFCLFVVCTQFWNNCDLIIIFIIFLDRHFIVIIDMLLRDFYFNTFIERMWWETKNRIWTMFKFIKTICNVCLTPKNVLGMVFRFFFEYCTELMKVLVFVHLFEGYLVNKHWIFSRSENFGF